MALFRIMYIHSSHEYVVQVNLYTKTGSVKYRSECAPNNGYFLIPLYDKVDQWLTLASQTHSHTSSFSILYRENMSWRWSHLKAGLLVGDPALYECADLFLSITIYTHMYRVRLRASNVVTWIMYISCPAYFIHPFIPHSPLPPSLSHQSPVRWLYW